MSLSPAELSWCRLVLPLLARMQPGGAEGGEGCFGSQSSGVAGGSDERLRGVFGADAEEAQRPGERPPGPDAAELAAARRGPHRDSPSRRERMVEVI